MSKRERKEEKDLRNQEKKVKVEGELKKKDKFTLLIRRRTISAASKLGFDGCLSILSRIM